VPRGGPHKQIPSLAVGPALVPLHGDFGRLSQRLKQLLQAVWISEQFDGAGGPWGCEVTRMLADEVIE